MIAGRRKLLAVRAIGGMGAAIGRDSAGIHAFSLVCTHAGCDMSVDGPVSAGSVQCFCHGSVFDGQGNLTIHGDQTCAPEPRLPA